MPNLLAIITVAFTLGIWCARYTNELLPLLYLSIMSILFVIVWQVSKRKPQIWSVALLFFVIGMLRFIHDDAVAPTDISHYAGQSLVVYGKVSELPKVTPLEENKSKVSYIVTIVGGEVAGNKLSMTGVLPVTVRQTSNIPLAQAGDDIQVTGEVVLLHGYNNPAQYDSVATAQRQNIRARMSTREQNVKVLTPHRGLSWQHRLASWREEMIANMKKVMPESHAAILAGMLFSGYEGIPHEVVADFATTGIVHILSVSGSHIALVVGVMTVLGSIVARRFGMNRKVVPLCAGGIVTFYAVFCGLTPPVLRSLIMGLIALIAVGLGREKDAGTALFVSVLGMLVYQPALLYDLSFQLSFASTAGLVFLNSKTVEKLAALPTWLAKLLAVTIAAQLGVLPFITWYFNSFSLSSLVANVMIVPLIEWIVILGLFGAFVGIFIVGLGHIIMMVCSLLISLVLVGTTWLAAMPGAKVYMPALGLCSGAIYYSLLAWVYGYKPQNMVSLTEVVQRWPRWSGVALLGMVVGIIVYNVYPRPVYVHFIDVGQGDATLIITPHGRAVLVDTGGVMGSGTDFDIGERVVVPYLKHYGVLSIDYLFLTHGHQDHAGGAAAIARALPVKNGMLAREAYTQAVRNLVLGAHGSLFIPVYEQQRIELDGLVIKVVHAVGGQNVQHHNEVSSVVQVCYGQHSFLLTGDLEGTGEQELLASGHDIESTVLKVGHHGSKTSSTIDFLQAVAPEYAVISVGANNHFGHPHGEIITRLQQQNSKIYRTDQQGAIVFETDGKTLNVDTFIK